MPSGISRLFDRSFQRNCAPLLDTEGLLSWSRASPAPQDGLHGLDASLTVPAVSGSVNPCHARINYDNVGIGRKAFSDNILVNLIFMVYLSEKILIHHKKRKAVSMLVESKVAESEIDFILEKVAEEYSSAFFHECAQQRTFPKSISCYQLS